MSTEGCQHEWRSHGLPCRLCGKRRTEHDDRVQLYGSGDERYLYLMVFLRANYPGAWEQARILWGDPEAAAPEGTLRGSR
jgi:hypothetical protein